MACKKHNYKGSKECKVCGEENSPFWGIVFLVIILLILS